jgi:hypothetical protein
MSLTTDPNHPDLKRYTGPEEPAPQHSVYLVLSEEERAKGFVRPVRRSYTHVGKPGTQNPLRDLTQEENNRYNIERSDGYVKYEEYSEERKKVSSVVGRFWTQKDLDAVGKGCRVSTKMGLALCETYARDPYFYGATYCCGCNKHLPVDEFIWDEDGERVGS